MPFSSRTLLIVRTAVRLSGMTSRPCRDRVSTTASLSEPGNVSATAATR